MRELGSYVMGPSARNRSQTCDTLPVGGLVNGSYGDMCGCYTEEAR